MQGSARQTMALALVGACCSLLLALLFALPVLRAAEVRAQDRLVRLWRSVSEADTKDIVLVTIDQETLDQCGSAWPLPHAVYARLVEALGAAGAHVIGIAVRLERGGTAEDPYLEGVLQRRGVVVARSTRPFDAACGNADLEQDSDGVLRTFAPLREVERGDEAGGDPALALAMLRRSTHDPHHLPRGFAGPAGTRYRIAWAGVSEGTFRTVSAAKLLSGADCSSSIKGRLVLVGSTLRSLEPPVRTPLTVSDETYETTLGAQANVLFTMASQMALTTLGGLESSLLLAVICFMLVQVLARLPVAVAAVMTLTCVALWLIGVAYALVEMQLLCPVWGPLAAIALAAAVSLGYRATRASVSAASGTSR